MCALVFNSLDALFLMLLDYLTMGAPNFIKYIPRVEINIYKACRAMRVGVDLYIWLYPILMQIAQNLSPDLTDAQREEAIVQQTIPRVTSFYQRLILHSIFPVLVLDGGSLPAKERAQLKRQQKREDAQRKLDALLNTIRTRPGR